jgi:hypothetical protein
MYKKAVFALLVLAAQVLFAQQNTAPAKYALVIGNGNYTGLSRLTNPVNDASDVATVLQELGFTVDKLLNASLDQMESAVMRLKNRLSTSGESYGFFFYAGHGVQSGGENYLIPVDANIPGENFLRGRAVSMQAVLDELNDARNSLNVVVLDACRDNPFGWARSGSRGLSIVGRQPADSIIVYATSAGQTASDGTGRNGLFTGQLLPNLRTPGLEVKEVFNRTGADVAEASGRQQIPAVYNQFFGTAYLGEAGATAQLPARPERAPAQQPATGRTSDPSRHLWTLGASAGSSFSDPWVVVTLRGTIAPLPYSFLEAGLDVGMVSAIAGSEYYSLYPFARYCFFMPFRAKGGWYIGAGGGYMVSRYSYAEKEYPENLFAADFTAGVNIGDVFDLSYTFRTDFKSAGGKLSAGYTYRFK